MTLLDWRPEVRSVQENIRTVLRTQRGADLSTEACKEWARAFIQQRVKGWQPGDALSPGAAQLVGAEFEKAVLLATGKRKRKRGYRRRYKGDA